MPPAQAAGGSSSDEDAELDSEAEDKQMVSLGNGQLAAADDFEEDDIQEDESSGDDEDEGEGDESSEDEDESLGDHDSEGEGESEDEGSEDEEQAAAHTAKVGARSASGTVCLTSTKR